MIKAKPTPKDVFMYHHLLKHRNFPNTKEESEIMRSQRSVEHKKNLCDEDKIKVKKYLKKHTSHKWIPTKEYGFRLFDFYCHDLGIAVEVNKPRQITNDKLAYNISGIFVFYTDLSNLDDLVYNITHQERTKEERIKMVGEQRDIKVKAFLRSIGNPPYIP